VGVIVGNIIQALMGIAGIILLVMLVWGGIMYATSAGAEDKITQAKKVITYAIIGLIIASMAFAITRYVITALF